MKTKKLVLNNKKFSDKQLIFAKEIFKGLKQVELTEQGKIKLKSAKELLQEL